MEVEITSERGEEGLDGVEDEGGSEDELVGAVRGGGDAFLQNGPGEAAKYRVRREKFSA